jgi:hypothetical protein
MSYNGVLATAENITLTGSLMANAGSLSSPGVAFYSFQNAEQWLVNGNSGAAPGDTDTLNFAGTNDPDTFNINMNAAGTSFDPVAKLESSSATLLTLLNYSNIATLGVSGLEGLDVFNVSTGALIARNILIDGGEPNGKRKLTDVLNVSYVSPKPKIVHSTATQNPDAGLINLDYGSATDLIQYVGVEKVVIRRA